MKKAIADQLDQFYTTQEYARSFFDEVKKHLDLSTFDNLIEPSAGTGSFYTLLDPSKRIGLDLDPKCDGVLQIDFFNWVPPSSGKNLTIGNPPFGKNANLAVKFFNNAAQFSDAIAFIVPKTFRKSSLTNRLDLNFIKIYDTDVPKDSFIYKDKPYDVWCCSQIWIKEHNNQQLRKKDHIFSLTDISDFIEITKDKNEADFGLQRVGGRAGQIRETNYKQYSALSHYFFKTKNIDSIPILKKINFDKVKFNTAGNPSISPSELVALFIESAESFGYHITLQKNTNDVLLSAKAKQKELFNSLFTFDRAPRSNKK